MIVVDIETSGWDPYKHGLLSIGALNFDNPENTFYGECSLRSDALCDASATAVNGFSEDMMRDTKKDSEVVLLQRFVDWSQDVHNKTLAGHNVGYFDANFLRVTFERHNITWPFYRRTVDLHSVAYAFMMQHGTQPQLGENKVSALSLDAVLEYLGLPKEPKPHNALNGAKYEAEALARLPLSKNLLSEFSQYPL